MVNKISDADAESRSVYLRFGHSDTVQPLMSTLGLYRDETDILASDWATQDQDHLWRTSQIGPFAANLGVLVFQCPEQVRKVVMLHNERIVETQPACGERVCSIEQFTQFYRDIADLNFEQECNV